MEVMKYYLEICTETTKKKNETLSTAQLMSQLGFKLDIS
jgi:hypothetical protein